MRKPFPPTHHNFIYALCFTILLIMTFYINTAPTAYLLVPVFLHQGHKVSTFPHFALLTDFKLTRDLFHSQVVIRPCSTYEKDHSIVVPATYFTYYNIVLYHPHCHNWIHSPFLIAKRYSILYICYFCFKVVFNFNCLKCRVACILIMLFLFSFYLVTMIGNTVNISFSITTEYWPS